LIRVGISEEWALLGVGLLNLLAVFAFVGVFCASHWMAKVAFLTLFLALLAIPFLEWYFTISEMRSH
jgi:hypothetical protein